MSPQRTCVGCREVTNAEELCRFVLLDGVLTPDPTGRLPGRGAWLHADPRCLAGAGVGFSRSLRTSVDVSVLGDWLKSRTRSQS